MDRLRADKLKRKRNNAREKDREVSSPLSLFYTSLVFYIRVRERERVEVAAALSCRCDAKLRAAGNNAARTKNWTVYSIYIYTASDSLFIYTLTNDVHVTRLHPRDESGCIR